MQTFVGSILDWYSSITARERWILMITSTALVAYCAWLPIELGMSFLETREALVVQRTRDYNQLEPNLKHFVKLDERFKKLQSMFKESEMSYEEVTRELDKIIKKAVGNIEYDLDKSRSTSDMGLNYTKQEFTVKIKSLGLSQLVSLLYNLEQGETPLFLGAVDITKNLDMPAPPGVEPKTHSGAFSASFEIFSISSKPTATGPRDYNEHKQ